MYDCPVRSGTLAPVVDKGICFEASAGGIEYIIPSPHILPHAEGPHVHLDCGSRPPYRKLLVERTYWRRSDCVLSGRFGAYLDSCNLRPSKVLPATRPVSSPSRMASPRRRYPVPADQCILHKETPTNRLSP